VLPQSQADADGDGDEVIAADHVSSSAKGNRSTTEAVSTVPAKVTTSSSSAIHRLHAELTCAICTQLYFHAAVLSCGHVVCEYPCLMECMKKSDVCPMCRKLITTDPSPCKTIDNAIDILIKDSDGSHSLSESDIAEYNDRKHQYEIFQQRESKKKKVLTDAIAGNTKAQRSFLSIQVQWKQEEKDTFARGITVYNTKEGRQAYCQLVGLSKQWIDSASIGSYCLPRLHLCVNDSMY
jgi:hypothetical protein